VVFAPIADDAVSNRKLRFPRLPVKTQLCRKFSPSKH